MLRKKQILYIDSSDRQRYLYLDGERVKNPIHSFSLYETTVEYKDENSDNSVYFKGYDAIVTFEYERYNETILAKRKFQCLGFEVIGNDFGLNHILTVEDKVVDNNYPSIQYCRIE